ncbi:MAG: molybdopterin-dependent oxidoreductase, partial [Bdellovibrionales bacterium]|nr:molybdopterin-dependent oxidoreductase [Bdellovibrionales bacterium]
PMHRLRVIQPQLGGGFGGKSDPFPHEMIAVKAALKTGRNIRLTFEREEVFYSHHGRHPTKIKMKLGVSKDKGIQALDGYMLIDGGAYGSFGVVTTYYNGVLLQGPYNIPNFNFHCDRVYTNKPMCGAMRGHGGVNPRFASEVLLDEACHQLKVDPCEMRLSHFHQPNSKTVNEFRITSVGIHHGLRNAMAASEWKSKHGKLPYGKGIGVGCGFFISGSALPIHWNEMPQSTVRLTIDYDGGVTLYSGASDIGQGSNTMLAQMAAEVLGLPISMIKVIAADTRTCPIDYGSYSSRVTFMAGNAARNAAIRMRRQLIEAACQLLEIDPPAKKKPGDPESFFRQGGRAPDYDSLYLGSNPNYEDGFTFTDEKIVAPNGQELAYMDVVRKGLDFQGALQSKGGYI